MLTNNVFSFEQPGPEKLGIYLAIPGLLGKHVIHYITNAPLKPCSNAFMDIMGWITFNICDCLSYSIKSET